MKSLKSKTLNLLVLISLTGSINVSRADDVIFIEKNQPAPYSGILFTEQKAQQLRKEVLESDKVRIELQSNQRKFELLSSIVKLKEEEIELYRDQNQRLVKAESASTTMSYVWFGLGVLATGIAVYGARSAAK